VHRLGLSELFRQSPVDDECLAMPADDDVPGLDVPVQYAVAMRVFDRVADVQEVAQQLA
jgi:hypothetical protein